MINKMLTGLLLTAFVVFAPQIAFADKKPALELDFAMAHKPDNEENVALIQKFADKVFERTNGEIKITPIDAYKEYGTEHGNILSNTVLKLYTGEAALSQVSVKKFVNYSPTIDALDMPMVFRDHDHVKAVVDGPIGNELREELLENSDGQIRGLAFTYSGGFRNIYTTSRPIASVADLKGMKMSVRSNRTSRDAVHHLGIVQSSDLYHNWVQANLNGEVMAEEAETLRLLTYDKTNPDLIKNIKTVLVTNHSVFLTLVAMNGGIFDTLTPEQQAIIQEEANALAEEERTLSIRQAIDGRKMFEERGIQFIDSSEEDQKLLREMAVKVHKKYEDQPVGKVVKAIIETK